MVKPIPPWIRRRIPPGLRREMRSVLDEWPTSEQLRQAGPFEGTIWYILETFLLVGLPAAYAWDTYAPWSGYRRAVRRNQAYDAFLAQRMPTVDTMAIEIEHRPKPGVGIDGQKDRFFDVLPPEIRRKILIFAFGQQTVHMDLQFRRPFAKTWKEGSHGGLPVRQKDEAGGNFIEQRMIGDKKWMWYSCVCHRHSPDEQDWLCHGRMAGNEFEKDTCLLGNGQCEHWPGKSQKKCYIGAMGWLLTCQRAYGHPFLGHVDGQELTFDRYFEGFDVLCRTNTIQISSAPLLRNIHHLLPHSLLQGMTSLELAWPASLSVKHRIREQGSERPPKGSSNRSNWDLAIFPALVHLRIAFKLDGSDGEKVTTPSKMLSEIRNTPQVDFTMEELGQVLDQCLLWHICRTVDQLCPASTDVVVSLPVQRWYSAVEAKLIASQGQEQTDSQISEFGGRKCWKSFTTWTSEGRQTRGLWVHIASDMD